MLDSRVRKVEIWRRVLGGLHHFGLPLLADFGRKLRVRRVELVPLLDPIVGRQGSFDDHLPRDILVMAFCVEFQQFDLLLGIERGPQESICHNLHPEYQYTGPFLCQASHVVPAYHDEGRGIRRLTCELSYQYIKLAFGFSTKWQPFGRLLSIVPLSKVSCILRMPLVKWVWKYLANAGWAISYCFEVPCSSPFTSLLGYMNRLSRKTPLWEKNWVTNACQ